MNSSVIEKIAPWQSALIQAVTDPAVLIDLLDLPKTLLPAAQLAAKHFPLKVPHSFIHRMKKGDDHDPLLQQVLPLGAELLDAEGFSTNPLQEDAYNPLPGLLHKYHGRVLLTVTGACGIHCRYCFRRNFPYEQNNPGSQGHLAIADYIARDTTITEVILSGGDPLSANDYLLSQLISRFATIPHLKRLRIHSRMPIVLPERITSEFITALSVSRLKPILVTHCNHPQEINSEVKNAMQRLQTAGITLLNQTVLLKGVNDDAEILIQLSERLFDVGILPYYLHVLDRVNGSAHFDLPRSTALALHTTLTARLSGFLVPRLVTEIPGAVAKQPVTSGNLK